MQNLVGAEEYGLFFSLFNFSIILNILLDLGITNYNNRNIAQHNQLLSKSLSNIVGLKLVLAIVYAVVTIGIAVIVGYEVRQFKLLLFLIINQFIASFLLYLRSNLSGLHLFKTDSLISVLDRTLMIVICGILLWSNSFNQNFKIEWFVYAQTAAYCITVLMTSVVVFYKSSFLKINFDRAYFIAILKKSYPFAILTLLMGIYYRIDSVMLERMVSKEQAGIYAQGFRVLDAISIFPFLFAGLLLPMFAKLLKDKESISKLSLFSFLLLIIPTIGISFSSYFYRVEIIDLLYHNHLESSSSIFGVLMLCFIGISVSYIFGTLLTANGSLRELNLIAGASVILNVVLNLILIPKYWAFGSAIASLITQGVTAIVQVFVAFKLFRFRIGFKKVFSLILFVGTIFLLSQYSIRFEYFWVYKYLGILIFTVFLAFVLRLLNIKFLIRLIFDSDQE